MKSIKQIFIAILLTIQYTCLFAQTQTPDVSEDIVLRNNYGDIKVLSFGLDATATDDIDPQLGEADLPPLPPIEIWEIRLKLPPSNWNLISSRKDYRNETSYPYTGQREYRLFYQVGENTDTLFIEWNFPPEITGVLQDLFGGIIVNQTMQGNGSFIMVVGGSPNPVDLKDLKMIIDFNNVVAGVNSETQLPADFELKQNYPNPFNPATTINISLPSVSEISLLVYDILGNEVVTIVKGRYEAGNYSFEFNMKNLSSGVYIYQLVHENGIISKKMTLLK